MKKNHNKYDHCCYCCEYSSPILDGESFICKKKGVVSPEFACSKFLYDPLKKEVSVKAISTQYCADDFKI